MKRHATSKTMNARAAYTLVEFMIAIAISVTVIATLMSLYVTGLFNFASLGNYQNLNVKNYSALDVLSREIRNSNLLLSYTTNVSLTLSNNMANHGAGQIDTITYDSNAQTVTLQRTGYALMTNLTQCTSWSFQLYTRAPDINSFSTNILFTTATNAAQCKVIQMTWKCSRAMMGQNFNSESVQTAQIVLRNKTSQ
jgi:hypothetical protein